jgi:hypothetical protein
MTGGFTNTSLASVPAILFNLAGAPAAAHHVIASFGFHPRLSAASGICCLVNVDGQQILGLGITSLGYLEAFGASGSGPTGPATLLTDALHPLANNQWYNIEVEAYCLSADGTGGRVQGMGQ